jgi:cell division protein FtsX
MRRELSCSRATVTTLPHLLSFLANDERSDLIETLMQAAVHMGDILALILLIGAFVLTGLMIRENLQPEPDGEDFATALFNKIERYRNDFQ